MARYAVTITQQTLEVDANNPQDAVCLGLAELAHMCERGSIQPDVHVIEWQAGKPLPPEITDHALPD